jgi:hypothetical protein
VQINFLILFHFFDIISNFTPEMVIRRVYSASVILVISNTPMNLVHAKLSVRSGQVYHRHEQAKIL